MQEIITVRVIIISVAGCSHSVRGWYKNLPQSDCTETALLQLDSTAGAEGEDDPHNNTLCGNQDFRWSLFFFSLDCKCFVIGGLYLLISTGLELAVEFS